MIPTNDERYTLELKKRIPNSNYEWEKAPTCTFKGRLANDIERKNYRIQKGVNGNTDSAFVYCSNLPKNVDVGDKIKFMGKVWSVQSIGYYFNSARFVNPGILSEEQLAERCPKGLNLQ